MLWGDLPHSSAGDNVEELRGADTQSAKRELSKTATETWQNLLESRKRPCGFGATAVWSDTPLEASVSTAETALMDSCGVELRFGCNDVLRVSSLSLLATRLPALWALLVDDPASSAAQGVHVVDFTEDGCCPRALRAVALLALQGRSDTSVAGRDLAHLWSGGTPRHVARGSRPEEAQGVEDDLRCLEVLWASGRLGLPVVTEAAESHLGAPGDASVLPLFAASFSRHRAVSQACLRRLTQRSAEVLRGRERQLGVLYATHPVAASVLSGVFKSACLTFKKHQSDARRRPLDSVVAELLFGQGAGGGLRLAAE